VVGVACDGTGFGIDGAVWGCEVLLCEGGDFQRLGHLEYFPLVGGDLAALETWRPAAAVLRAAYRYTGRSAGEIVRFLRPAGAPAAAPTDEELRVFAQQLASGVNAPPTSSLGRVFDAVSFLLGLCPRNRHEAEAAMAVEAAAAGVPVEVPPFAFEVAATDDGLRLSLLPAIREIVAARDAGASVGLVAAQFHETVARLLATAAGQVCRQHAVTKVAISGGCFANRRLLTRLVELLEGNGHTVLYHRRVPPGDGGIALGQALVAAWQVAGTARQ
jgi:hydrogenase maturation protein HypF